MKTEYFEARNQARLSDKLETRDREIKTFIKIIKFSDAEYEFKEKVFVDVGCGDAYLRKPVEKNMMKYTGFDIDECDLISDLMPLILKVLIF